MKTSEIFSLTKRTEIAFNFLRKNVDPRRGCLPYFVTIFKKDPAEARHDWPDFSDLTARYVEAFILGRKMLNMTEVDPVERQLRKLLLSYFDEGDGFSYRPKPEKPYYSTIFRRLYDGHVAEGFDQARVLWALTAWYKESKDTGLLSRIEDMISGLDRVMVKRQEYGYYDRSNWQGDFIVSQSAEPMPHQAYFCGTQIHPLIECYRQFSLPGALGLAQRLTNYIMDHSDYFFADGSWNCRYGEGFESAVMDGHTHSRFATLAGIITVGIVCENDDLIARGKRSYDWFIKNHCSSFGWSPEFLGRFGDAEEGCETCTIMDQINVLLALIEAGNSEYYEDLEKITRNQLIENQLIDTKLVRNTVDREDTELSCFHNVADMVYGGFAGWAGPNDFIGNCDHHYCLMNCCGPAGVRAMHDVWNNIYSIDGDSVIINVYMDKVDKVLSIANRCPYSDEFFIEPFRDCRLMLRLRSWMRPDKMIISIDNVPCDFAVNDGLIDVGKVAAGSKVLVKGLIAGYKTSEKANGRDYEVFWQGDTVVEISPPGEIMPLYQNRR